MKKLTYFLMLLALAFASCSKEEAGNDGGAKGNGGSAVPDPSGTATANLMMGEDIYISSFSDFLYLNKSNNFYFYYNSEIIDIGEVKGLGNVRNAPESGYYGEIAAIKGHGYIGRYQYSYKDSKVLKYIRFYVVDYISSGSSISGVTIKYQDPFYPENIDFSDNNSTSNAASN